MTCDIGFSVNGGSQYGWFTMEKNLWKQKIWVSPHFRKPPYVTWTTGDRARWHRVVGRSKWHSDIWLLGYQWIHMSSGHVWNWSRKIVQLQIPLPNMKFYEILRYLESWDSLIHPHIGLGANQLHCGSSVSIIWLGNSIRSSLAPHLIGMNTSRPRKISHRFSSHAFCQ